MFKLVKNLCRKSIWIPYEQFWEWPTISKAKEAIASYCADAGWTYDFIEEDKVKINNEVYTIWRGQDPRNWGGGYAIELCKLYKKEHQGITD